MSCVGGPVPYKVVSAYEALVAEVDSAATQSDCGAVRWNACFRASVAGKIDFSAFLHLPRWRARSSSPKGRLNILVQVQETIISAVPNYRLERSTVRTAYFEMEDNVATLLHSVHFDYGPAQICHPIFHAQVTSETIPLSGPIAQELEFEFMPEIIGAVFKNARIPTCDMTMPAVLLCLAADHLKPQLFPGLLSRVRELQERLPQPTFASTQQSIAAEPGQLRSSHWFAHTPGYF